tara:strand:+ start:346 stop:897 length:552 start_codon:yes stop_codon:yes gene_type:complete
MYTVEFMIGYIRENHAILKQGFFYEDFEELLELAYGARGSLSEKVHVYRLLVQTWLFFNPSETHFYFWKNCSATLINDKISCELEWVRDMMDFSVWETDDLFKETFPMLHPKLQAFARRSLNMKRWRWVVQWMNRVRPYAWHWFEEHQKVSCAPDGKGRKRDREEFEATFQSGAAKWGEAVLS